MESEKRVVQDTDASGVTDYFSQNADEAAKNEEKAAKVLEKVDKESGIRTFKEGKLGLIISTLTIAFSLLHIYSLGIKPIEALKFRMIHVTGIVALIFLFYPARKGSPRKQPSIVDWCLFTAMVIAGFYTALINIDVISLRGGGYVLLDQILGIIIVFLVLEAARRTAGRVLVILSLIFLTYAFTGQYLPGILHHKGFTIKRVFTYLYMSADGLLGTTTGVSASYVFLFCLFGAFLAKSGMSRLFNDFSVSVAGNSPGGPAKVAVLCSGMMGMVSGSAASNVATTGAFTIPLMKSLGYPNYFAGAVEAVASTAGQITPPVMGAGAFLMAEFLGIPYSTIALAAILPCILYYFCCWMSVHLRAQKLGMKGVAKEDLPKTTVVLKEQGYLIIPLVFMIVMLCLGYTATYVAVRAILLTVVVSWVRKSTRMGWKEVLKALDDGCRGALSVCCACIVVCNVVGIISLTGLGTRLGTAVISLSHGHLILALVLTMIVTMILGMGLPTSAAYIITATIAAPILVKMGVVPLSAHFFVFYFAMLAGITPPVAVTAYIGAGIADASPFKTAVAAMKLGIAGFIVPYMFVYAPQMLMQETSVMTTILVILTSIVGTYMLACAVEGYMYDFAPWYSRMLMIIAALCLVYPGVFTDGIGAGAAVLAVVIQKRKAGKKGEKTQEAAA
ncbi:MAG: TRAP transporter permease [Firmicutes bacterium]|nr:TRAP transporter permease [Bacillota bacterium]